MKHTFILRFISGTKPGFVFVCSLLCYKHFRYIRAWYLFRPGTEFLVGCLVGYCERGGNTSKMLLLYMNLQCCRQHRWDESSIAQEMLASEMLVLQVLPSYTDRVFWVLIAIRAKRKTLCCLYFIVFSRFFRPPLPERKKCSLTEYKSSISYFFIFGIVPMLHIRFLF